MGAEFIRELQTAIKTGKVVLGSRKTIKLLSTGKAKMVILAQNAPTIIAEEIKYKARLAGIPVYVFEGTSKDLGAACNKPFFVSAIAVLDPGESNLIEMAKGARA
ncbi:50S ribosomal protein L30e [Thermofilum pendens]|uniref:Large ribosomal subunit protein eL30 n=1 Tax=Thermofilum pendens (strain DSM 2475 / Hrk 5) TaxID=368408 RepID=A1RWW3_THEPD|nr:50S ribosomal protein L30e [Thermofilum pendens]ABL77693.1 LSU ribosomal protein L30E [Thermofilum pendens Hrk 5]